MSAALGRQDGRRPSGASAGFPRPHARAIKVSESLVVPAPARHAHVAGGLIKRGHVLLAARIDPGQQIAGGGSPPAQGRSN